MSVSLSPRVSALIADAAREVGTGYTVLQGSWSTDVGASAGTHAGGGAFDLRSRGYSREQSLAWVNALRERNVCAWWRTPEFGWPTSAGGPHIHGIVRDEPGLSAAAAQQVRDYDRGLNGLASQGRDPFPRPPQTPFQYPPPTPTPTPAPEDDMAFTANGPDGQTWHLSGVWRKRITWDQANALAGLAGAAKVPFLGAIPAEALAAYKDAE